MGVHMTDGLAAVYTCVEDNPVAVVRDALGYGDIVRVRHDLGQQAVPGRSQLAHVGVMGTRDNENVYRCLRIDVAEGDRPSAGGHYRRRNVGCGDAAEQAIGHDDDLNVCQAWDASDIYGCTTANPRMHHLSGATVSPVSGFRRTW